MSPIWLLLWSNRVLVGKISLCSPDHISLLVHKTFNVSIPRHHIPTDEWEFQYGPAENDPEFGAGAEQDSEEGSGNWIHRVTASPLGEEEGYLEFTVIGQVMHYLSSSTTNMKKLLV